VLARYGQVLDVSRDDLEDILLQTEQRAYARRFGTVNCGAIMSKDVVTATPTMPLDEAWRLLRHHNLHALPVLDASHRVAGIIGQGDFLHHAGLDDYQTVGERLRGLFAHVLGVRPERAGTVGELMSTKVAVVSKDEPIATLVPLMSNGGLHHIPVVDERAVFLGVVSQSDLLAALFESRLAEAA
jgi:CBS domain-containing membrane protein